MRELPVELMNEVSMHADADALDTLIRAMALAPGDPAQPVLTYARASAGAPKILIERYLEIRLGATFVAMPGAPPGDTARAIRARRNTLLTAANQVAWQDVGTRYWPEAAVTARLLRTYLPAGGALLFKDWYPTGVDSVAAALGRRATPAEALIIADAQQAVRARLAEPAVRDVPWVDRMWPERDHMVINARFRATGLSPLTTHVGGHLFLDGGPTTQRQNTRNVEVVLNTLHVLTTGDSIATGVLPSLVTIGQDFYMSQPGADPGTAGLARIEANVVQSLESVGRHLLIGNLPELRSLRGAFPSLVRVGNTLSIHNMEKLEDTSGAFPSLRRCDRFVIENNEALTTLGGAFAVLEEIDTSYLTLESMPSLEELRGAFPLLRRVGGGFHLEHLHTLVDITGAFPSLRRCDRFVIQNNEALTTLGGAFAVLEEIYTSYLTLESMPSLEELRGAFPLLRRVGGGFHLEHLHTLVDITGAFPSLQSCGKLVLLDNPVLVTLSDAFAVLDEIDSSYLSVEGCNSLKDLTGAFPSLRQVYTSVFVEKNAALTAINGFRALRVIGINLVITDNPSLASIGTFQSLHRVGNSIIVRDNARLRALGDDEFPSLPTSADRRPSFQFIPGRQ
jgi:hypothetical protein